MFEYTFNVLVEFAQKLQRFSTNTLGTFTHAVLSDLPYWVAPVVFEGGFIHPSLCLSASPHFELFLDKEFVEDRYAPHM